MKRIRNWLRRRKRRGVPTGSGEVTVRLRYDAEGRVVAVQTGDGWLFFDPHLSARPTNRN